MRARTGLTACGILAAITATPLTADPLMLRVLQDNSGAFRVTVVP